MDEQERLNRLLQECQNADERIYLSEQLSLTRALIREIESRLTDPESCREWLTDVQSKLYSDELKSGDRESLRFALMDVEPYLDALRHDPDEFTRIISDVLVILNSQMRRLNRRYEAILPEVEHE